jgi:hypothetical protein
MSTLKDLMLLLLMSLDTVSVVPSGETSSSTVLTELSRDTNGTSTRRLSLEILQKNHLLTWLAGARQLDFIQEELCLLSLTTPSSYISAPILFPCTMFVLVLEALTRTFSVFKMTKTPRVPI